ncbi:MAG: fumarylacetoacetate hydrolase family protein [Bacteroidetes bacterium]|nr:fumarylacetoacetate hydrolase family protein [Bacteroidota bacterium]
MKLVTYKTEKEHFGLMVNGEIYAVTMVDSRLPDDLLSFLELGEEGLSMLRAAEKKLMEGTLVLEPVVGCQLLAPVPRPTSCRDGYAFRQHVATARRNRGLEMIPEFDQYPIFYFTNHHAIFGPGEVMLMPDHFRQLDFELEAAVVIGKPGRNIRAAEADQYIAGYTIMNDLSARTLQMEEMLLNLGPAKGKDFATVIGPWLVTPDELETKKVATKPLHTGTQFDLVMTCTVNGKEVSRGNLKEMDWTFAEIIERCSYGVDLYPGDVIGSGTVGTGCFLELNGTGKLNHPNYQPQWLQPGDVVTLEIDGLGSLTNTMVAEKTDWSILNLKKK